MQINLVLYHRCGDVYKLVMLRCFTCWSATPCIWLLH